MPAPTKPDGSLDLKKIAKGAPPHEKKPGFFARLRTYFLTGVVVAAPVALTIYLIVSFVRFIDGVVVPLIPARFNPESYLPFALPGLGVIIMLTALTLLGAFAANFLGRALIRFGDRVLDRVPVIRNIYGALKQIFETVISQNQASFRDVGMIEYPRRGVYSVVFITTESKGEVQQRIEDEQLISVFLPTTPNPTSGFLLFVPKREVIYLDMTIEEAAKMVISAGLVAPDWPKKADDAIEDASNGGTGRSNGRKPR